MSRRSAFLTAGLWIAALTGIPAFAQDQDQDADPPGRAARLGYLNGTVSFQPGGVEDWVPATPNRPLTTGDRLWTEAGARAEVHLGSSAIRLNGRTSFSFINLDDNLAQIQVSTGTVVVRLRRLLDQEGFEIDTPQGAFSLLRPGDYRVEVSDQGDSTIVTVRGGDGEVTAGGQAFPVHARQQVRISGAEGQPPVFDQRELPVPDAFDNFCQDRDRREDMSQSARYVSRDLPGYADLDDNGVWREVPDYGMVWAPRVDAGWAPYHYGHWVWIEPWGWTWVDDAPWGYAPFHYGRWAMAGGGWVWIPGPVAVRPVYSPALVAWVGGPNFGISIGIGMGPAVGWFPLGPREVWVPAYHYSPAYITRVNVTNTVIVNRAVFNNVSVTNVTYMNRGVAGAVTVVPQGAMVSGRAVAAAAVAVPPASIARAQVVNYAAVAPQREAIIGVRAGAAAPAPPRVVVNRTVVTRVAPPPAPVPFAQRQATLQANPGQPVAPAQLNRIRTTTITTAPAYRPAMPQTPAPAVVNRAPAPVAPAPAAVPAPAPRPGQPAATIPGPAPRPQVVTPQPGAPVISGPARTVPPSATSAPPVQTAPPAPQQRSIERSVTRSTEVNRPPQNQQQQQAPKPRPAQQHREQKREEK